jgi:cell division septation protein DedD
MAKQRNYDEEDAPERAPTGGNRGSADREISLGAPTILGIFFALAVLCACFFGFGYTMGRKSAQIGPADATVPTPVSFGTSAKPAAGSPASLPPVSQPATGDSAATTPAETETAPVETPAKNSAADAMIVGDKPAPASAESHTSSGQPPMPAISPTGTIMVQIAAVSSQDVADILLASLKKKGYTVAVRHEPQDKLLHVQIGPFATRKDADAMCQRVLADGFNAIVK